MKKQKKIGGLEDILLNLPTAKKVELMYSIGMSHDNPQEVYQMAVMLSQNGYHKESLELFSRASSMGNAQATTRKAQCLLVGEGCVADHKAALKAFEQSAGQGDLWGTLAAAFLYHVGLGVERNYKKAEKYLANVINNELLTSQICKTDTKTIIK